MVFRDFDRTKAMMFKEHSETEGWVNRGILVGSQHPCFSQVIQILDEYKLNKVKEDNE